jgi:hemoglobin
MSRLYDAIGGLPALEVAVERFSQRVAADPELRQFFVGMDLHGIKNHLIAFLGHSVGGPIRYTGSTMRRAHEHLHIEQRHFDLFAEHLKETLREVAVSDPLVAAVMKRVWPLANQIVNLVRMSAAAD